MKLSKDLERDASAQVASLMAAAARTAPKTRGIDNIDVIVIDDESTKNALISAMKTISKNESRPSLERDANSIAECHHIVIIGVKSNPAGLNCGFCGRKTCEHLASEKGVCAYNSIDLGLACSSACSIASNFHIDNRLMYSIGKAAIETKLLGSEIKQVLWIPLSITGKSPFFDRK